MTGRVVDETGGPLAGARVFVLDSAATAVTDSEGRFTLEGLAAGTRIVLVERAGAQTVREQVELASGESVRVEIRLPLILLTTRVEVRGNEIASGVSTTREGITPPVLDLPPLP